LAMRIEGSEIRRNDNQMMAGKYNKDKYSAFQILMVDIWITQKWWAK